MSAHLHTLISKKTILPLVVATVLFWTPCIIFFKVADEIVEKEPLFFDKPILQAIHSHATPFWDSFFVTITNLGGFIGILCFMVAVSGYLLWKKHYAHALFVAASVGGAAAANVILKSFFQRARPDLWEHLVIEKNFSFPSGHAMVSSAFILALIYLAWHTKYRIAAIVAGALFIILIGFSRLYLGVHYPSDVLAGWCVSAAWVAIVYGVMVHIQKRHKH